MYPDIQYKYRLLLGHVYRAIGKVDIATVHYQKAKEIAQSMDSENDDHTVLAFIYQQLCIYENGSNSEPLKNLTPLLNKSSLSVATETVLQQALGNIYRSAADYHNAKGHLKEAIKLAKKNGDILKATECKAHLGRVYRSSGCYSKALKCQKKLLDFALESGDTLNIAAACGYIGFTHYCMGERYYDEAVKYLYCKLELSKHELEDVAGYRWCLNNLGKIYLAMKEHGICMKLFSESGEIAKQHNNTLGLGTAYGNLGSACRAISKHEEAIKYHKLYLEIAEKNFDTGGIAIMQRELMLDHLYLYDDENDVKKRDTFLEGARMYGFQALKTSLEVRSRFSREDDMLKIGNFEHNQVQTYSLILFTLIQQGQYEAGLLISELGRAHAIADRISSKFQLNSSFLKDIFHVIGSDNQLCSSALSSALCKVGETIGGFKSHMLIYSVLENPLNRGKGKETLLYTWHVQRRQSAAVDVQVDIHFHQCVMNSNLSGSDLGSKSVIDEDYVTDLMREIQVSKKEVIEESADQINNNGAVSRDIVRRKKVEPVKSKDRFEELYNLLIRPVHQYLDQDVGRLIIIPHSFLFSVPFCALKNQGSYLVEKFVMCLSPSLYMLDIGLQREKKWSELPIHKKDVGILAVGNPKMPLEQIEQLPGAEKEVKNIATLGQHTKLLIGKDATKKEVICGFSEYPVIHLATHAIVKDSLSDHLAALDAADTKLDIGDYSVKGAIILAKSDPDCSGVLTSSEIEKLVLEPSCELVVLSCCNTACGKITGDGILGLSRSLLCAGVMNMLLTYWPIHDSSTALLMKHFYSHYMEHRDAPVALRVSMLHLIHQNYNVERWAAFCCISIRYNSFY